MISHGDSSSKGSSNLSSLSEHIFKTSFEGLSEGDAEGFCVVGESVGKLVGLSVVGAADGILVGNAEGVSVDEEVGSDDGSIEGETVGLLVGRAVVGSKVGIGVGDTVGASEFTKIYSFRQSMK
jgi:hypothetical protein